MKITYKRARATVAEIVLEKGGDHKYEAPLGLYAYFDERGGCIVGNALARWGVTREDLGSTNIGTGFTLLTPESFDLEFTPKAHRFMCALQEHQDRGMVWGEAFAQAVAEMDNFDADC